MVRVVIFILLTILTQGFCKYYRIKNPESGLCLDAVLDRVTAWPCSDWNSQLWSVQLGDKGRFVFINKDNGKALEAPEGGKLHGSLTTSQKTTAENQQWYIASYGWIYNGASNTSVIEIADKKTTLGLRVWMAEELGTYDQIFVFV